MIFSHLYSCVLLTLQHEKKSPHLFLIRFQQKWTQIFFSLLKSPGNIVLFKLEKVEREIERERKRESERKKECCAVIFFSYRISHNNQNTLGMLTSLISYVKNKTILSFLDQKV